MCDPSHCPRYAWLSLCMLVSVGTSLMELLFCLLSSKGYLVEVNKLPGSLAFRLQSLFFREGRVMCQHSVIPFIGENLIP